MKIKTHSMNIAGDLVVDLFGKKKKPLLLITGSEKEAKHLKRAIDFFKPDTLSHFPQEDTLPFEDQAPSPFIQSDRIQTLLSCLDEKKPWVVASQAALTTWLPQPHFFHQRRFKIEVGAVLSLDAFRLRLVQLGYQLVDAVKKPGEFAQRGGVLDFFPCAHALPYRIDWFDDTIDDIRSFHVEDQRTLSSHTLLETQTPILWHKEAVEKSHLATFQSWLNRHEKIKTRIDQGMDLPSFCLPMVHAKLSTLLDYMPKDVEIIWLNDLTSMVEKTHAQIDEHDLKSDCLPKQIAYLTEKKWHHFFKPSQIIEPETLPQPKKTDVHITMLGSKADMDEWSKKEKLSVEWVSIDQWPKKRTDRTFAMIGPFKQGFYSRCLQAHLLIPSQKRVIKQKSEQWIKKTLSDDLIDLKKDDYVLHQDHGIGLYKGLEKLSYHDTESECVVIEYLGASRLFVPTDQLHLLSRYHLSPGEASPECHPLNGKAWKKQKKILEKKVRDTAAEILDQQRARQAHRRPPYHIDETEYARFCDLFPFQLTEDQQSTLEAIFDDLSQEHTMDRLVCGDVGFGKTEVAVRTAWAVLQKGKQVAVLVPTTLLAKQHFQTFKERFQEEAIHIALLTGGESKQKQKTIEDMAAHKVDLIIATHALLNKKIKFADLGLLVVDEEQRFGVRQKETIQSWRSYVDILTLTATPIPRTLQYTLSSLRDLSLITTPPSSRLAIESTIIPWEKALVAQGIEREIQRGGQIVFCIDRVQSIASYQKQLAVWFPDLEMAIAHGQMPKKQLSQVMEDFENEEFTLLLCSTIIESGLDYPNANTLFVMNADRFGLTQLHQIRGRVGRSHYQAYAYFIVQDETYMSEHAKHRLEALVQHSDLGCGFQLALEDLEIRGAGELFGHHQSGHLKTISFAMYAELVQEAMQQLSGEVETTSCEMHGYFSYLLPDDYLPDVPLRLKFYRRLSHTKTLDDLLDIRDELHDRFGTPPLLAKRLLEMHVLKILGEQKSISAMHIKKDKTLLTLNLPFPYCPNVSPTFALMNITSPSTIELCYAEQTPETLLEQLKVTLTGWEQLNA